MGILSWLIVGLVAGYIGSKLVNRTGEGLMRDLLLGVIGAIVGGAVFHALGLCGRYGGEPAKHTGRSSWIRDRPRRISCRDRPAGGEISLVALVIVSRKDRFAA